MNQRFRLLPIELLDSANRIAEFSEKAILNFASSMGY